jgi:transcription factor C subunit 3
LPLEQTSVEAHDLEELEETPPPPKRMKRKSEALIGLSKKEKLEALGLDENWTEYNALVMNKPTPGVYITPQGRRRPVGKSRGRPRISRIAIFKSPKLSTFAWFVKDEGDSDNEDPEDGAIITPRESVAPSIADPDPLGITPSLRNPSPIKRAHPNQNTPTPPSPYSASSTNDANSERPSKRPRLNMAKTESIEESLGIAHQTSSEAGTFATHDIATPRNRDKSLSVHMVEDEQTPTPSKRRRVESGSVIEDKTPNKPSPPPHPFARTGAVSRKKTDIRVSDRTKTPKQPTLSRRIPRGLRGKSLTEQEQQLLAAPKPLIERGGSISVLRRKVIMEIMDKANGSYPGGSLIWYPFVTRWMNMGHKQKPDMKTVRNTVKQLVDAGHLRQLTFCGKDKKGLTVTKTLLIKSDVDPESPSVETMKKRFLAMDPNEPRPEFCENVEVDQLLTRSSGRPHGEPPRRQKFSFPVEKGAHFNLHQKPAYIVNEESRRSRQIQRSYRKHIATEARIEARIAAAAKEELEIPGVQRLMTLSRPPTLNDRTSTKTSIMRPRIRVKTRESHQPQNPIIRANRLMKPISTIGSYAMLMKPPQHFHMATGTFSTGSCSLKSKRGRKPKLIVKANKGVKIQTSSVDDAVIELSRLAHDGKDPLKAPETPKDHSFETFCSRADKISEWEIDREPLFDEDLEDQPYINQTVEEIFETAPIEGNICFVTDMPPPPPRTPAKLSPQKRSESRRKRESVPEPPKDETPKRKSKQRRIGRTTLNRRLAKLDEPSAVAPVPEKDVQQAPRQRFRRQRSLRNLPDQLARKLMVALVAVRVLAGGAESRVIDWHLVTLAFPDYEPSFIEGRARQVLNKNRLQMIKMQRDFQDRFLEAYAKDEVPSIDYSDLESYDWPALVEWANVNLDVFTSQQVPELPATREQFDSVFQLREEPATAGDQLYQAVHGVTINHKRDLMARNPFAIPLEYQPSPKLTQRREELAQLENAKSWVRANIITPEITYKPNEATDILALFGESLLREATQALMNERVICSINRRDSPDRNYDISENFLQALSRKRGIDSTQLRRAISFKSTILDSEIKQTGSSEVKYNAEDGDILALINLHASGHIKLHPQDAPRDKFGLTDGGYLTRQMDKRRLRFPVKIVPTGKYIHGNPVKDKAATVVIPPPPPASGPGHPPRTPLWYDINGELEPHLWKMTMGPVLGCLVMRPGVKAQNISNMIKPILGAWEALKMLKWMEEVGIVEADGEGEKACWRLRESWWMIAA